MNNLKKYRIAKGFSQDKLSKLCGLKSRGYIYQCEAGIRKLSLSTAKKIASVLNVNVYDLMGDDLIRNNIPQDDKSQVASALEKSNRSSFEEALINLVYSYLGEQEYNSFKSDKDKLFFYICNSIVKYKEVITEEELSKIYFWISSFIDKEDLPTKQAKFEFKEDLISSKGNKENN